METEIEEVLEEIDLTTLEPVDVKYTITSPPPEGRCNALSFTCRNEDCPHTWEVEDRETTHCPICKSSRARCGNYPRKGRNRCGFHGGATLSGIQHPNFKGRSLSTNLPTRLTQLAHLTNRDNRKEFLGYMDDIEMLDIRKLDLYQRLDNNDSKKTWNDLNKAMSRYRKYQNEFQSGKTSSGRKMLSEINKIESLIVRGGKDYLIWQEIGTVMEQGRKLRESQIKKDEAEQNVITKDQAREIIASFLSIIKTRVKDETLRASMLNDITQMIAVTK